MFYHIYGFKPSNCADYRKRDPQVTKSILENIIDDHAKAKVDTLVQCVFGAGFKSHLPSSQVTDLIPPTHRLYELDEAGIDFLTLLINRCHKNKMKFIAGLRMNDRHGMDRGKPIKEHPEWQLTGIGPVSLDYSHEGVRGHLLEFIEEILDTYDVDGIEFDYMRWCHMFKPREGKKNAHLLTDFHRKVRKLLDAAAKRRGIKKLELGVRVPQTLRECEYLGFDVAGWIKQGLVDYVSPMDFFYTAINAKTEDFVKLSKGTDCKVYPGIAPCSYWGDEDSSVRISLASHRAAVQNFYAFGADGLAPYNFSLGQLNLLTGLRDPQKIKQSARHYLFYAIWPRSLRASETSFYHDDNIYIKRFRSDAYGSRRFRIAEDFSNPKLRGTLQFKAVGMKAGEELEIQINGTIVPHKYITRVFDKDGRSKPEGGKELPPFYKYTIDLNWISPNTPIINGDNQLTVRLITTQHRSRDIVTVDELEVYIVLVLGSSGFFQVDFV